MFEKHLSYLEYEHILYRNEISYVKIKFFLLYWTCFLLNIKVLQFLRQ